MDSVSFEETKQDLETLLYVSAWAISALIFAIPYRIIERIYNETKKALRWQ